MTDYFQRSLEMHQRLRGKIGVSSKLPITNRDDLSIAYTPGVARPCEVIAKDISQARELTIKRNSVAVVTDGSSVLGLGNIGAYAAIPVMEGKALLFRELAGIDAWPICMDTQDVKELIDTIRRIAPVFGGINLEDIAAPRCFEIENNLQDLGIPVFHDDQHGTAVVLLAALLNGAKALGRKPTDLRVVVSGAGAAGTAIAQLLHCVGQDPNVCEPVKDIIICDSKGALHRGRTDLTPEKQALLKYSNRENKKGSLAEVLEGSDVFVGVSRANLITASDVKRMNPNPIVFAMANPVPEIMPEEAQKGEAAIIGTGRSDYANQINNVLAFPGIFRGAFDGGAKRIDAHMKLVAAHAIADCVKQPTAENILPDPLDRHVPLAVAKAVVEATPH